MALKICNKCKQEKDINEFHRNHTRKDGRDSWCAICSNEYNKEYYTINKDLKKRRSSERNKKHREKAKTCAYTYFNLLVSKNMYKADGKYLFDMYSNSPYCYYCGLKFGTHIGIHVEHKIPKSRGGKSTNDNLVISCGKCNRFKGTMTDKEFISFLKDYVKRVYKKLDLDDRGEPKGC